MTTTAATATATATSGHYTVTAPNGQTIEFNAKADYAFVVISRQGEWYLSLKTNSESAARTKVSKVIAAGARWGQEYECLIIPVQHS